MKRQELVALRYMKLLDNGVVWQRRLLARIVHFVRLNTFYTFFFLTFSHFRITINNNTFSLFLLFILHQ
jgi:hypothetical protein